MNKTYVTNVYDILELYFFIEIFIYCREGAQTCPVVSFTAVSE